LTAFYDRLILRQLAEEANTLGDFGLKLALQAFHDLNVAGGDDLLARLTAAVATRGPLDPTVLRAIRNYLFRIQGDDAGMAMEMTRAFASVGAPVPDWVRTAPDGLSEP
jgi:hypothetical protein